MKYRNIVFVLFLFLLFGCNKANDAKPQQAGTLNREVRVLAWVGYEEPEITRPFEQRTGITVRTETFTGADKMFAKLSQAPDAYDVVVIDPEYIAKLNNAGLLTSLEEGDFDFSEYVAPLERFPLCWIDGEMKSVLVRYGINALVYNTEHLTKEEVSSYNILFSGKVTQKVGIWDWYLPNMGIISLLNGNKPPYSVGSDQLSGIEEKLTLLKPQVRAVMATFSDVNSALARGEVWVVPAHGEHTAAVLAEEGLPIDWVVPKEGGIMWIETLGIPPLAKNKDNAISYIKYLQQPSTLAKLTWRRAYRSNTPSVEAISLLNETQRSMLKVNSAQDAEELIDAVEVRMLPTDDTGASSEAEWQAIWQSFKADI